MAISSQEAKEKKAVGLWEACDNPQRQTVLRGKQPHVSLARRMSHRESGVKNQPGISRRQEKCKFPGSVAP